MIAELKSPVDGIVFFAHDEPLTYANTAVFKMLEREVYFLSLYNELIKKIEKRIIELNYRNRSR